MAKTKALNFLPAKGRYELSLVHMKFIIFMTKQMIYLELEDKTSQIAGKLKRMNVHIKLYSTI